MFALPALAAQPAPGMLGARKFWHTPYYILRGDTPGPTVLIQAGIHGDEQAGTYALDAMLKGLTIRNGTLIVIPRLNAPAFARERRYLNYDLNRAFASPGRRRPYEFSLASTLIAFARDQRIDYMVTLHEAHWLYDPAVAKSLGQTLCYGVQPEPPLLADWLTRLNTTIAAPADRFNVKYFPISTSSTEVMTAALSLKGGYCVETWRELAFPRRVAYQRAAVETFLASVGIDFRYGADSIRPSRPGAVMAPQ
jgi:hypothetical protein